MPPGPGPTWPGPPGPCPPGPWAAAGHTASGRAAAKAIRRTNRVRVVIGVTFAPRSVFKCWLTSEFHTLNAFGAIERFHELLDVSALLQRAPERDLNGQALFGSRHADEL